MVLLCFSWQTIKSPLGCLGLFCSRTKRIRTVLPFIEATSKAITASVIQASVCQAVKWFLDSGLVAAARLPCFRRLFWKTTGSPNGFRQFITPGTADRMTCRLEWAVFPLYIQWGDAELGSDGCCVLSSVGLCHTVEDPRVQEISHLFNGGSSKPSIFCPGEIYLYHSGQEANLSPDPEGNSVSSFPDFLFKKQKMSLKRLSGRTAFTGQDMQKLEICLPSTFHLAASQKS